MKYVPWNIQTELTNSDQYGVIQQYLLDQLVFKFTDSALFDTTSSYDMMDDGTTRICGNLIASFSDILPTDATTVV